MAASKYRWIVIAVLFAITVVNYIDRAAIAYAIPAIQRDLGLSPAAAGSIMGAFGIGYAVTTLLGGFAVDRYGARIVLTLAAILWSLAVGTTALATGLLTLYAARLVLGISEGPNFPALTGAVSRWLAPHERATALGNALFAVPLALAFGGPVVAQLLEMLDWRSAFGVLFLFSAVWGPLWYFLFRDDPAQSPHVNAAELALIRGSEPAAAAVCAAPVSHGRALRQLLGNPTLLANYLAYFSYGYFLFFFMWWLPSYLEQVYGLNLHTVGLFSVAPWLAGAVALWVMGRVSDHLLKTTGSLRVARSYPIAISQLVAALAVVPVIFTSSLDIAMACITVAVAAAMAPNALFYVVNVDVAPRRSATSLGIMDFSFALAGFAAPVVTGMVLKLRGSFTDSFVLMALLAFAAVIVVLLFHHPDRHCESAVAVPAPPVRP